MALWRSNRRAQTQCFQQARRTNAKPVYTVKYENGEEESNLDDSVFSRMLFKPTEYTMSDVLVGSLHERYGPNVPSFAFGLQKFQRLVSKNFSGGILSPHSHTYYPPFGAWIEH